MNDINNLCSKIHRNIDADSPLFFDFLRQSGKEMISLSKLNNSLYDYGNTSINKRILEPVSSGGSSPCFSEAEDSNSDLKQRKKEFSLYEIGKMLIDSSSATEITHDTSWYSCILLLGSYNEDNKKKVVLHLEKKLSKDFPVVRDVFYKGETGLTFQFQDNLSSQKAYKLFTQDYVLKNIVQQRWKVIRFYDRMIEPAFISQFFGVLIKDLPTNCKQETIQEMVTMSCHQITCLHIEPPAHIGDTFFSFIRTNSLEDAEVIALSLNGLETENGTIRAGLHPSCSMIHKDSESDPFKFIKHLSKDNGSHNKSVPKISTNLISSSIKIEAKIEHQSDKNSKRGTEIEEEEPVNLDRSRQINEYDPFKSTQIKSTSFTPKQEELGEFRYEENFPSYFCNPAPYPQQGFFSPNPYSFRPNLPPAIIAPREENHPSFNHGQNFFQPEPNYDQRDQNRFPPMFPNANHPFYNNNPFPNYIHSNLYEQKQQGLFQQEQYEQHPQYFDEPSRLPNMPRRGRKYVNKANLGVNRNWKSTSHSTDRDKLGHSASNIHAHQKPNIKSHHNEPHQDYYSNKRSRNDSLDKPRSPSVGSCDGKGEEQANNKEENVTNSEVIVHETKTQHTQIGDWQIEVKLLDLGPNSCEFEPAPSKKFFAESPRKLYETVKQKSRNLLEIPQHKNSTISNTQSPRNDLENLGGEGHTTEGASIEDWKMYHCQSQEKQDTQKMEEHETMGKISTNVSCQESEETKMQILKDTSKSDWQIMIHASKDADPIDCTSIPDYAKKKSLMPHKANMPKYIESSVADNSFYKEDSFVQNYRTTSLNRVGRQRKISARREERTRNWRLRSKQMREEAHQQNLHFNARKDDMHFRHPTSRTKNSKPIRRNSNMPIQSEEDFKYRYPALADPQTCRSDKMEEEFSSSLNKDSSKQPRKEESSFSSSRMEIEQPETKSVPTKRKETSPEKCTSKIMGEWCINFQDKDERVHENQKEILPEIRPTPTNPILFTTDVPSYMSSDILVQRKKEREILLNATANNKKVLESVPEKIVNKEIEAQPSSNQSVKQIEKSTPTKVSKKIKEDSEPKREKSKDKFSRRAQMQPVQVPIQMLPHNSMFNPQSNMPFFYIPGMPSAFACSSYMMNVPHPQFMMHQNPNQQMHFPPQMTVCHNNLILNPVMSHQHPMMNNGGQMPNFVPNPVPNFNDAGPKYEQLMKREEQAFKDLGAKPLITDKFLSNIKEENSVSQEMIPEPETTPPQIPNEDYDDRV